MIRLALFGAGRIGQVHARSIAANWRARLVHVIDPAPGMAAPLAARTGASNSTAEDAISDSEVDGYIIASPTETHAPLLEQLAAAGRPVFCEKPISLDLAQAEGCTARLEVAGTRCMVGFHRRFDPGFAHAKRRIAAGEVGKIFQIVVASRSWAPPSDAYIRSSGGLFSDQTIHDFDMVRFLLGEEIASVYAVGGCRVEPRIGALGDIDVAMLTLVSVSGALAQIANGRFAAHGYDQRIEVFGTKASLFVGNLAQDSLVAGARYGLISSAPQPTFSERYRDAYERELDAFLAFIEGQKTDAATLNDALAAQRLAEAALESMRVGTPVHLCPGPT